MKSPHTYNRATLFIQHGLTLIEIMVTLAVVAVTLSIGVPSFQGMASSNRMSSAANNLIGALNVARSEAIKRGARVKVIVTTASGITSWKVQLSSDSTDVGTIKAFDPIAGMQVTGSSAEYQFLPTGFLSLTAAE
ncbi:MAG: GspH/FimT family pseudopilin, partial [Gammaproteobacteria bacterium]|nr:GspH/FimT family pseudopilin [Gammaproteobacteria bacterium]